MCRWEYPGIHLEPLECDRRLQWARRFALWNPWGQLPQGGSDEENIEDDFIIPVPGDSEDSCAQSEDVISIVRKGHLVSSFYSTRVLINDIHEERLFS